MTVKKAATAALYIGTISLIFYAILPEAQAWEQGHINNTVRASSEVATSAIVNGAGSATAWAHSSSHGKVVSSLNANPGSLAAQSNTWTGAESFASHSQTGSGVGAAYANSQVLGFSTVNARMSVPGGSLHVLTSAFTQDSVTAWSDQSKPNSSNQASSTSDATSQSRANLYFDPTLTFYDNKNVFQKGTSFSSVYTEGKNNYAASQAVEYGEANITVSHP